MVTSLLVSTMWGDDQRSGGRGSSFTSWMLDPQCICPTSFFLLSARMLHAQQLLIGSFRSRQHAGGTHMISS